MPLIEVTMHRVECDVEGCKQTPQSGEYYAWLGADVAVSEAQDSDWFVSRDGKRFFCPQHQPQCQHKDQGGDLDCGLSLHDDEFGEQCEDHAPEESVQS